MTKESRFKKEYGVFVESTSLHGLRTVGDSKARVVRRAFWLLLMLVMLTLLMYYFVNGLTTYLRYPTTTRINLFKNFSLVFPAVTICNINLIRSTYMAENPLIGNISGYYSQLFQRHPTINLSDPDVLEEMKNISYVDMYTKGGHRLEEMVPSCSWNKVPVDSSEVFSSVMSDILGNCFTFNRDGIVSSANPGNLYGLELVIDVQQHLYSHFVTNAGAGIKVLIHAPKSMPVFQTKALAIPPGSIVELMINRKKDIFLPEPYDGPGCYDGDEYASLADCNLLCNTKYLVSKCDCLVLPHLMKGYRNCSLYEQINCIVPAAIEYWLNKSHEVSCGCLHHCTEVSYDVKASQLVYPSDFATSYYNEMLGVNYTAKDYGKNYVTLKIYYDNLLTTVTEQVGAYTFANFSAEIGGFLGLFLGASLLTLTEILEFLIFFLKSFCKKKSKVDQNYNG